MAFFVAVFVAHGGKMASTHGEWGKYNGNGYDNKLRTVREETGCWLLSKHAQKES
jgi:hypothetical protein